MRLWANAHTNAKLKKTRRTYEQMRTLMLKLGRGGGDTYDQIRILMQKLKKKRRAYDQVRKLLQELVGWCVGEGRVYELLSF